jgi:hypothetical protein
MGMSISRERAETHTSAVEGRALQAGIAAGISALQGINPLLEAERERRERFAEMLNPSRGLIEALRVQTSGLERIAEASSASLRRMAEACAPRIAPLGIGLKLNAISALGSIGNLAAVAALADLHVPVRIHAIPRLPSQSAPRPGRCRDAVLDGPPFTPVREVPRHPEPTDWLEDGLDDEGGRRVLEQLSRFVRSEEIPSDAREGMSVLITWWKLNRLRITSDQSLELNRIVQSFIGAQLGLTTAPDGHQQLRSGLLVPRSESCPQPPAVELDPRIHTYLELSKILNYNDSTIRRQAETAWTKAGGRGPCPLRKGSNWYVVAAAEDGGGQKRGWKFQKRRALEER